MAKEMNTSHDSLYRNFDNPIEKANALLDDLTTMSLNTLNLEKLYLIFDDTQITKLYAKQIEGLEVGFDGSLGMAAPGMKMVTALLTDRKINIPINAIPYFSKELALGLYQTKSEIAVHITKLIIETFKITRILGDAHYATKQTIRYLSEQQLPFLMKIPCNRVVTINGLTGQLKHIFRLQKNQRVKSVKGTFDGIDCYFYVVKIKNGTTVYLISNDRIDPYAVIEIYRIRWNIELFHRVAKQYLGLSDCQMRSIEKQRLHVIYVMSAYAIANVKKVLTGLPCVEHVINYLRDVKQQLRGSSNPASDDNFAYVA